MKCLILVLVIAVVAFVAVTGWALEAGGVALVQTTRSDETRRAIHVWYVRRDGETLLEAGTPENGWFVDALRDPNVVTDDACARRGLLAGSYDTDQ